MFNSRYPMIAIAMNQVSDLKLALACAHAGIVPSISVYNYQDDGVNLNYCGIDKDIKSFKQECPDSDLIMSIGSDELLVKGINAPLIPILVKHKVKYVELIERKNYPPDELNQILDAMEYLRTQGVLFIYKFVRNFVKADSLVEDFAVFGTPWAITIKGPDGAGRVTTGISLRERVLNVIEADLGLKIIATGGISTPDDVQELLDLGIIAVGCGTPFAVSKESLIKEEVKLSMIAKTFADLDNLPLGKTEDDGISQRALVFQNEGRDPYNNTNGLKSGIYMPGRGHVFAGRALDSINSIRTVQETVNYFFSGYSRE